MPSEAVVVKEIEEAERLCAQCEFARSFSILQKMLPLALSKKIRMRLMYNVVTCSIWMNEEDILNKAINELKEFPNYEVSYAFIVMTKASALVVKGQAQDALELINNNLDNAVLQEKDFQGWKYEYLFLKGRALTQLAQCDEALRAFGDAQRLCAKGKYEIDILLDKANCLLGLERYEESYEMASRVRASGDEEMATLAMQYMAECRMWQQRFLEAFELYSAIQKRLPCRLINEERIQTGIKSVLTYIDGVGPKGKPS